MIHGLLEGSGQPFFFKVPSENLLPAAKFSQKLGWPLGCRWRICSQPNLEV